MKKNKKSSARNLFILIAVLVLLFLIYVLVGAGSASGSLSLFKKSGLANMVASFSASGAPSTPSTPSTSGALRAGEIYVGNAYNANGCKNEFIKGTKTPYAVIPVKKGRITSLDGYTPLAYYGLSSVKLNIPEGYTAFIGKKGSSSNSLSDVGWTLTKKDGTSCINLGSYNDQATAILVAPKCTIVAYGGYNATGKFTAEVKRLVAVWKSNNKEKDVLVITPNTSNEGFQKAYIAGQSAYNDMARVQGENSQNTLAIFHSISSIGAFNYNIKSNPSRKLKVYLWDPPYDGWYLKFTPDNFDSNVKDIKLAVKNGIVKSPDIVNITKGKAKEPEHSDETKLAPVVNAWLNANCK